MPSRCMDCFINLVKEVETEILITYYERFIEKLIVELKNIVLYVYII